MKLACFIALIVGILLGLWAFGAAVADKSASIPGEIGIDKDREDCPLCKGEGGICGKFCRNCNGTGSIVIYRTVEDDGIEPEQEPDCQFKLHRLK